MKKICAITMARNDEFFLNKWILYYGEQLGYNNLYVVLDGDDQPNPALADRINIIYKEHIKTDVANGDKIRINFINNKAHELLNGYDIVIGCDADEFLVVDPNINKSLCEYLSGLKIKASVSALGIDVGQNLNTETAINSNINFLEQRGFAVVSSRYTKPVVINKKVEWGAGFHRIKGHNFYIDDNLYLFHFGGFDDEMLKAKFSDSDKINEGWLKHLNKRRKTSLMVTKRKAVDGDKLFAFARNLQRYLRKPYAINKPSTAYFKLVVRIPKRFDNII